MEPLRQSLAWCIGAAHHGTGSTAAAGASCAVSGARRLHHQCTTRSVRRTECAARPFLGRTTDPARSWRPGAGGDSGLVFLEEPEMGDADRIRRGRQARILGSSRLSQRSRSVERRKIQLMAEPVWNKFLTERDKLVFEAAGYGTRAGFGKRPALLVIDVSYAFCGDKPEPILESIKRWRNSCGEDAWAGISQIKRLIDKAHEKALPVIYTTGVRRADNWDAGAWARKNSRNGEAPKAGSN